MRFISVLVVVSLVLGPFVIAGTGDIEKSEPTEFTVVQRNTAAVPGFEKNQQVHVAVDDITSGQVQVEVYQLQEGEGENGARKNILLVRKSMRTGDSREFTLSGRKYRIKLKRLANYLIGDDFALFEIMEVPVKKAPAPLKTQKV